MPTFDLIAFDADDTLWHSESLYAGMEDRFKQLLARYHDLEWIQQRLFETETRNVALFGYGVKSFTLSMIETAIELTEGRITGKEIQQILDMAREMLSAEVRLLDHVPETVAALAARYPLMIITKGDLLDQEAKIARSGLAQHFRHVEIVSEKTPDGYTSLLARHGLEAARFLMVGNSLRSDILPVLEIGGHAVHIPYHITWAHEVVNNPPAGPGAYHELPSMGELLPLLQRLTGEA